MKSKQVTSQIFLCALFIQILSGTIMAATRDIPISKDGRMRASNSVPDSQIGTLMQVDPRGGEVISIPNFDLSKPGAKWELSKINMAYEAIPGTPYGFYRFKSLVGGDYVDEMIANSIEYIKAKPNRSYVVSALINCDFERTKKLDPEINIGVVDWGRVRIPGLLDSKGDPFDPSFVEGVPNQTGGWVRWEWETPYPTNCKTLQFLIQPYNFSRSPSQQFKIADLKIIELPPKPLVPYAKGEGVTFRGGVGKIPMRVSSSHVTPETITIETTGARYIFDLQKDLITAEQLLELQRPIAIWKSSQHLSGLRVMKEDSSVCVLANDWVTFGIQADSMMMVAPQAELILTCTSKIAGKWNRFYAGHLVASDDFGGMTVNPDLPAGTGRVPRTQALTPDLDFVGVANNTTFLSQAKAGWEIGWTVSPGERLAISVFPPRPFDWKESFDYRPAKTWNIVKTEEYSYYYPAGVYSATLPWHWTLGMAYGMSFGPQYVPLDKGKLRDDIAKIRSLKMKPCQYLSGYYYYSRDAQEYVDEVRRWKSEFGIEGVYIDNLPNWSDWIIGYEELRMVRELFPEGPVTLHTTGQPGGGGAPIGLPDFFMPFIDTYATATARGEAVHGEGKGKEWPYVRYVTCQFRKANCIGFNLTTWWRLPNTLQADIALLHNGRMWGDPWDYQPDGQPGGSLDSDNFRNYYLPKLIKLRKLWQDKGSNPQFYEKFYLPKVRELTGNPLNGGPIIELPHN